MITTPIETLEQLAETWQEQAKADDLKVGTKTYSKFERVFWVGVMRTLVSVGHEPSTALYIYLSSGRSPTQEILNKKVERERTETKKPLEEKKQPAMTCEVPLA